MNKITFFILTAAPTVLVFLLFNHKFNRAQQIIETQGAQVETYKRLYLEANTKLKNIEECWLWQHFKAAHKNEKP